MPTGSPVTHRRPVAVGSFAADVSPYGVVDLVGNAMEWTLSAPPVTDVLDVVAGVPLLRSLLRAPVGHFRTARGCNWNDVECTGAQSLFDFTGLPNQRAFDLRTFWIGFRCRESLTTSLR